MLKLAAFGRVILILSVTLCLPACGGATPVAHYDGTSIVSQSHPFRVEVAPLGPDWILQNMQPDQEKGRMVGKVGDEYRRVVSFDSNGDGRYNWRQMVRRYELLYRNRDTDARLSLSVFPIDQQLERTDLTVLAREYVDAASGAGSVEVDWGDERKATVEKRFASRILDIEPVSVEGYDAVGVTFEVANVDQLQLSDESRWIRARMLLIRAPWRWTVKTSSYGPMHDTTWPVMMRVLFTARPEAFERSSAAFERFVEGLQFFADDQVLAEHHDEIRQCLMSHDLDVVSLEMSVGPKGTMDRIRSGDVTDYGVQKCLLDIDLQFAGTGRKRVVVLSVARDRPTVRDTVAAAFGERWPSSSDEPPAVVSTETSGGDAPIGEMETEVAATPSTAAGSEPIESRLEKLKSLHERGLISDEEYQSKRAAILDSI